MIYESREGFYFYLNGRKHGFWRSRAEAQAGFQVEQRRASSSSSSYERDTSADFAIGLATGVPMPSAEGIIGASIHNAIDTSSSSACDASSSYDSSPCSSDSGSSW